MLEMLETVGEQRDGHANNYTDKISVLGPSPQFLYMFDFVVIRQDRGSGTPTKLSIDRPHSMHPIDDTMLGSESNAEKDALVVLS